RINHTAKGGHHFGGFRPVAVREYHRFTAAQWQTRHCIFETHTAGKPQCICHCGFAILVMPESRAACSRTQMCGMNCNNRAQTGFSVVKEMDTLMPVKILQIPHSHHWKALQLVRNLIWMYSNNR